MSVQEGNKAYSEGEKKLKGNMLGFGRDPDGAIDDFKRACNNYKVAGAFQEAAKCQIRIAEVAEKLNESYEVASACMEAAKLNIKAQSINTAIAMLQRAKNVYIQNGKVTQAARACKELAEAVKDGDKGAQKLALQTYLEAAKLYDSDSQYAEMNKMRIEAAKLMVTLGQLAEASQLFEHVANEYVSNHLLKYSARDLYLNALLCLMALNDTTTALTKREEYQVSDVQFQGSRQEGLVSKCLNAMLAQNPEDFSTAVQEWESMTKLEPFRVTLLLAAKENIAVKGAVADMTLGDGDDGDDLGIL